MYFGLGTGPFAAVEGFQGEFDEELIGGNPAIAGLFDALPLLGGDADVLLDGLNHGSSSRVWPVPGRRSVSDGTNIGSEAKLPDWCLS